MIRYTDKYIEQLLAKFMNGESTLEEEARLGDYFRTQKVRPEWEEYRMMFAYFDSGMEGPIVEVKPTARGKWLRRIVAVAACVAVICGVATLFLRDNGQEQLTAKVERKTIRIVKPKDEQSAAVVVTVKADKPAVERKKAKKRRAPRVIEAVKDVEQAEEELLRTQQEIAEAYNEIAEALEEAVATEIEVQMALAETKQDMEEVLNDVPRLENKRTLIMH